MITTAAVQPSFPSLTHNAVEVLEGRYLRKTADGGFESFDALLRRVAHGIAKDKSSENTYFTRMRSLEFLPNSPTLFNAGSDRPLLSACFVLPIDDALDSIFDSLKLMARIQHLGGGTGFSFSRLRPCGDVVKFQDQTAAGPIGFLEIFDIATHNIKQGGRRRGANMGILRVDHPDIESFINCKRGNSRFENFNLSVGLTDAFMECVLQGSNFSLRHPKTGKETRTIKAVQLLETLAEAAWESGDPGVVFLDTINRAHPLERLGAIEATNPCGEVPLLPFEACNLGSVNLAKFLSPDYRQLDWNRLDAAVTDGVRFLDDTIDAALFPSPEIEAIVRANRKIGLGVMGFAEICTRLKIRYDTDEAVELARTLIQRIRVTADAASLALGRDRGPYPNWQLSRDQLAFRNATRLSIAPTGTLSLIAGTTAGIEPLFAKTFLRKHILGGKTQTEITPIADDAFIRTALEIAPEWHLKIQEAFQSQVDNAVSKTINLPETATVSDVRTIYTRAWGLKLKGVTIYRYGSKGTQVLNLPTHCGPGGCPTA